MTSNFSAVPYVSSANLIDCQNPTNGYSKPSYSMAPSCSPSFPNCDNRSYSAYATQSAYNSYYDDCFNPFPKNNACDLTVLNATPKVVSECWKNCCDQNMANCSETCQVDCVVNKSSPQPAPQPTPQPVAPTPGAPVMPLGVPMVMSDAKPITFSFPTSM